jgi:hypothetical protein
MKTYTEISTAAKAIVKSKSKEAFELYNRLWKEFSDEFNDWDAMYMIQAAKHSNYRVYGDLIPLVEKFKADEKVTGNFGWYIYDLFVKSKDAVSLRGNEKPIMSLLELGVQKNFSVPQDYPCAFTLSAFKLLDAFSDQASFNAAKVKSCLKLLNPEFLSAKEENYTTAEGKEIVNASMKEKYYSKLSKALDKLDEFDRCLEVSREGLEKLDSFHNDNDLWFQYRIAKSELGIGNFDIAKGLFEELVKTRVGSTKWFLFKEIAKIYFDKGDYKTAQNFSIKGLLLGEEIKLSKELYILQAQLFFRFKQLDNVKVIADLLNSFYLEDEEAKISVESKKLLDFCKVTPENAYSLEEAKAIANELFVNIRFEGQIVLKGKVVNINKNGKSGLIVAISGEKFVFRKQNFKKKQRDLLLLNGAKVSFFKSEDYTGKSVADIITIDEMPKGLSLGQKMNGKICGISEIGVFVDFQSGEKGLIHKSKLPPNFQTKYKRGMLLKVKVNKETNKGLDLLLDE